MNLEKNVHKLADDKLYQLTFTEYPKDCAQYKEGGDSESRTRAIDPLGTNHDIATYCDQETEGGGWTTILNRDESQVHENFDRTHVEYENGFGDRNGEFWLGL